MGITKREIASELGVSKRTIANYIGKLGLGNHVSRNGNTDILDDFAAGLRGVENIADSLFPIIEIVKIFVKHAAHMFQ